MRFRAYCASSATSSCLGGRERGVPIGEWTLLLSFKVPSREGTNLLRISLVLVLAI